MEKLGDPSEPSNINRHTIANANTAKHHINRTTIPPTSRLFWAWTCSPATYGFQL